MRVRGVVEETIIYGEFLRLTRTITSRLGSNVLEIDDTVENLAFQPAPLMLMYHCNFGFPLLDECRADHLSVTPSHPRDAGTAGRVYRLGHARTRTMTPASISTTNWMPMPRAGPQR